MKVREVMGCMQALYLLRPWVRPGSLAMTFAGVKIALLPHAQAIEEQQQALRDEFSPSVDGKPAPTIVEVKVNGEVVGERFVATDVPAFAERDRQLSATEVIVDLPYLLDDSDFDKIEANMPKSAPAGEPPDLAALAPVMVGSARLVTE
jgi:hypothetical protein